MSESLLLDTKLKPLEGTKGWSVKAFEIAKKENAGFDGTISIEGPNATERVHVNWTAVYQDEGNWRLINKKNSTTILHELRSVNTALQTFITKGLNGYRNSCRVILQPAEIPPPPRRDPEDAETAKSAEREGAQGKSLEKRLKPSISPSPETAESIPSALAQPRGTAVVHLTKEQQEVAKLFVCNLTYKEIAERLHISISAVGHKMERVYKKLSVHNRVELEALIETPHVTVGEVPLFFKSIAKRAEGTSEHTKEKDTPVSMPVNRLLHLLAKAERTGIATVDETNDLVRYIEFCKGILPAGYMFTYKLGVDETGHPKAEILLRPVK